MAGEPWARCKRLSTCDASVGAPTTGEYLMRWWVVVAIFAILLGSVVGAQKADPVALEAMRLLEEALTLARQAPSAEERADAVARVAAEIARHDPKRALSIVAEELETHQQSVAISRAAETLARDNRLLGLATLLRIDDLSTVVVALAHIVAMEALTDFDEAKKITDHIELLTIRRIVERDVARAIWAEMPGDRKVAVQVSVRWAQAIPDLVTRNEALALAAEGAATIDLVEAEEIASYISDVEPRDLAWRLVIQQVAAHDPVSAQNLLGCIVTPLQRDLAGAAVVGGLVAVGRTQEAIRFAADVRKSANEDIENLLDRSAILEQLAVALAGVDSSTASSILSEIWPPAFRYRVQCRLVRVPGFADAAMARELLEDAWVELRRHDSPLVQQEIAAAVLAGAAVAAPDLIDSLAVQRPELVQAALPAASALLAGDEPEAALALVARIDDLRAAEEARAYIAQIVAPRNDELAQNIIQQLTLPAPKSAALVGRAAAVWSRSLG
ncbi:MAG: hypothetical protein ACUVX8_18490 [Candidatus Zipacnadales bacterium]